ncbi:MAG: AraC family transcriptional regulator [Verrucomicrobiaceae bacterium]|nr:MAG: AraC family transcriptional regulator [Verrucomicrobiaceae bacterium]
MIHASAAEKISMPAEGNTLARVDVRDLLQPFDSLPGAFYIVKDRLSRVIAISPEAVKRMGYREESEVLGKLPADYLPPELAEKFCEDDRWVMERGIPRLGMVEMWFNVQGGRDWISTNKYPLRSPDGEVVGIVGILQNLDIREKRFAYLGPVGDAADHIRSHLGEPLMVGEIARRTGFSERQLQRNFRKVFGQTIQQYIIASRIHAAIGDLTASGLRISEIALKYGFNDQSAFSNCFRRLTGQSPHAYRVKALECG